MKIVLIGMAGVGKSYIGKILAESIKYKFVDVDDSLFNETGLNTTKLLKKVGDEEFLNIEDKVFKKVSKQDNTVFAPGGSIIYCKSFYENLNQFEVIYLEGNFKEIFARIKKNKRGVVYSGKMDMKDLFEERVKLYEKYSDYRIDAARDSKVIVKELRDILKV